MFFLVRISKYIIFQIFQDSGKSTNHYEKYEILLVSEIVKSKQKQKTLKKSNGEKDMKMQQLQKKIEQVTEQNVVSTKIVDEMSNNLKMVSETLSALKKELKILKDEPG